MIVETEQNSRIGVVVDDLVGVSEFGGQKLIESQTYRADLSRYVDGYVSLEERLVTIVNMKKILSETDFEQLRKSVEAEERIGA